MTEKPWNPRYLAYCRWHGKNPEGMDAHDRAAWPGGNMCGFMLWTRERIQEAYKAIPDAFIHGGGLVDHDRYDEWLTGRVERHLAESSGAGPANA